MKLCNTSVVRLPTGSRTPVQIEGMGWKGGQFGGWGGAGWII